MSDALAQVRAVAGIARDAAAAILPIYHSDFAVETKADASPVTAADVAAQRVIVAGLAALAPELPVVAEESRAAPWATRRGWARYWLVDPLDGTREFVKRNGEFTVNIALIDGHRSVLGVVLAPVTGELYAAALGAGAWLEPAPGASWWRLAARPLARPPVVAGSRSHGNLPDAVLDALLGPERQQVAMGSSLKFCLLARGAADVYLRLGATSEWDTGAAHCVLDEAGGAVLDLRGRTLAYNAKESLVNPEFIAVGDRSIDWPGRLAAAGLAARVPG